MDLSQYVGLPFKERGRDRNGVDCWGLLRLVYAEQFGINLPSYSADYSSADDWQAITGLITGNIGAWIEVAAGKERPGDGLLMSVAGSPLHVGIVVGAGRVLHAEQGHGAIIESYHGFRLRRRLCGFFRHTDARNCAGVQRDAA